MNWRKRQVMLCVFTILARSVTSRMIQDVEQLRYRSPHFHPERIIIIVLCPKFRECGTCTIYPGLPRGETVLDLTGKVALVSGAGSTGRGWGNGKAMAVLFARQGAKVFGTD